MIFMNVLKEPFRNDNFLHAWSYHKELLKGTYPQHVWIWILNVNKHNKYYSLFSFYS